MLRRLCGCDQMYMFMNTREQKTLLAYEQNKLLNASSECQFRNLVSGSNSDQTSYIIKRASAFNW